MYLEFQSAFIILTGRAIDKPWTCITFFVTDDFQLPYNCFILLQSTLKKARCEMMILAPILCNKGKEELFCWQRVSMLPNKGRFSYLILSYKVKIPHPLFLKLFFLSLSKLRQCVLCIGDRRGWSSANGKNKFNRWITFNSVVTKLYSRTGSTTSKIYPNLKIIELIIMFFCSLSSIKITYYYWEVQNMKSRNVSANVEIVKSVTYASNKTDCLYMFPCDPKYQFCFSCRHF